MAKQPRTNQNDDTAAPVSGEQAASTEAQADAAAKTVSETPAVNAAALDASASPEIQKTANAALVGTIDEWAAAARAEIERVHAQFQANPDWLVPELARFCDAITGVGNAIAHVIADIDRRRAASDDALVAAVLTKRGYTAADVLTINRGVILLRTGQRVPLT